MSLTRSQMKVQQLTPGAAQQVDSAGQTATAADQRVVVRVVFLPPPAAQLSARTPPRGHRNAWSRVHDTIGGADPSPKRQRGVFVDRSLVFTPARLRSGLG